VAAEAGAEISELAVSTSEIENVTEEKIEEPINDIDYSSMTVPQLKDLLKESGKTVSGKKADLIARLNE
jgi:riboflavin synthase